MAATSEQKATHKRVRTPTLLQMEALECGAAALGIVLGYYGKFLPLEELRVTCGVSRDGSNAGNVIRAARGYGLTGKGYRLEPDAALTQKFPIIVFWNFNHFLVVDGVKGDTVYLNDPATGPRTVTRSEFDDAFTGVCLVLEPGPEFETGGRPRTLFQGLRWRLRGSESAVTYVVLVSLLLIIPGIVIPGLFRIFVDDYLVAGREEWIAPLLVGMGITLILRIGLTWLQQKYLLLTETKLALTSSAAFLWHVLRCPVEFFSQRYAGDISQRVRSNNNVAVLLSRELATSIVNMFSVLFYAAVMAMFDWLLTVIAVTLALLNVAAVQLVGRQRADTSMRLMQERGKLVATATGGLQIIETLKATGSENDFFNRWSGYQAKVINSEQKLGLVNQLVAVLPAFLSSLGTVIVLGVGGFRVIDGALTVGSLVAFQTLMASFNGPIQGLVQFSGSAQQIHGDLARLDDVLKYRQDARFSKDATLPPVNGPSKLVGQVDLRGVTFGYSRLGPPLIEDFNLHLEPGARVALVGASGSGKSTIARLVVGLYEPWSGSVKVDGKRLDHIPNDVLSASMTSVDQDIFLFDGNVRDNLTLWDDLVSDESITQASKDACIYDVVAARPDGFADHVASGGANFSGGQA